MAEHQCILYAQDSRLETKIARCFAFVGPYLPLRAHFAIGNFVGDALNGGPIVIKGDGTAYRSYLYAADLAIWLWTILFLGGAFRPYNVGSEVSASVREIAMAVARSASSDIRVQLLGTGDKGGAGAKYVPCTTRARRELGLQEYVGLEESIRRTFMFHRSIADG
jgi:dTDP-glucose 4,6-dehydratase